MSTYYLYSCSDVKLERISMNRAWHVPVGSALGNSNTTPYTSRQLQLSGSTTVDYHAYSRTDPVGSVPDKSAQSWTQ
jgi:hypothetical protein